MTSLPGLLAKSARNPGYHLAATTAAHQRSRPKRPDLQDAAQRHDFGNLTYLAKFVGLESPTYVAEFVGLESPTYVLFPIARYSSSKRVIRSSFEKPRLTCSRAFAATR